MEFAIICLAAILIILAACLYSAEKRARALNKQYLESEQSIRYLNTHVAKLSQELGHKDARLAFLAPYQSVGDAQEYIRQASITARELEDRAKVAINEMKLRQAQAQAFKNVIDGYGDEHLLPAESFMSGLADGFSHIDAGQNLKKAINYSKTLIKTKMAAETDLSDPEIKKKAIALIVDTFNSKVEILLTKNKIKTENAGKLKQSLDDSWTIINSQWSALGNTQISRRYLNARQDELKWVVIAAEIKERMDEEQRRIKEQLREEARARREYERAVRESREEEARIQSAIEKVQTQAAKAGEEQKAKYELQLEKLMTRLQEAEAKAARATSMAQLTRAGHVYVISNHGSFGDDVLKIGMTRRLEPMDRVKELGDASVPFGFDVHAMIYCEDAPALEGLLHQKFNASRVNKVNPRKEFFKANISDVRAIVEELKLDAHFTMAAEAREYRETIAIEQMPDDERKRYLGNLLKREAIILADPLGGDDDEAA